MSIPNINTAEIWYLYWTDIKSIALILCFCPLSSVCNPMNCYCWFVFVLEMNKYTLKMHYEKCLNTFVLLVSTSQYRHRQYWPCVYLVLDRYQNLEYWTALLFGLPLFLLPVTSIFRILWPLFLLRACPSCPNCSTWSVPLMPSFLVMLILVTPNEKSDHVKLCHFQLNLLYFCKKTKLLFV